MESKQGRWAAVPCHRPMVDGEKLGPLVYRYTTRREAEIHVDEIRRWWPAATVVDLDTCEVSFTYRAPGAREREQAENEAKMAAGRPIVLSPAHGAAGEGD